jgi:hypothetical protein
MKEYNPLFNVVLQSAAHNGFLEFVHQNNFPQNYDFQEVRHDAPGGGPS